MVAQEISRENYVTLVNEFLSEGRINLNFIWEHYNLNAPVKLIKDLKIFQQLFTSWMEHPTGGMHIMWEGIYTFYNLHFNVTITKSEEGQILKVF